MSPQRFEDDGWDSSMRVLMVTHEASRSGAPRIAALAGRSIASAGYDVRFVSRAGGPLIELFRAIGPTEVEPFVRLRGWARSVRFARWLGQFADRIVAKLEVARFRPGLVYINSSSAAVYLRPALSRGSHVVLHVHESGVVAARFLEASGGILGSAGITWVACSPTVRLELSALLGLSLDDIVLLPSVPDDHDVQSKSDCPPDRFYGRDELIVGCCGSVEYRKGADLWVDIAGMVLGQLPHLQIRFVWIGEIVDPALAVSVAGVEFLGPSSNPYAHMRRFDIATLPSRDDPFPLVVLEAMSLGTPVVAFRVGGVAEQIGDCGTVVDPGDVSAFADAIVSLLVNHEDRLEVGRRAVIRTRLLYSTSTFSKEVVRTVDCIRNGAFK